MLFKVMGKQFITGEYKGNPFSTVKLFVEKPLKDSDFGRAEGMAVREFKIKKKDEKFYESIKIGDNVELSFDYYGNVTECDVVFF